MNENNIHNLRCGDSVEVQVVGYDYGSKPVWIPAIAGQPRRHRMWVTFQLKCGKELTRCLAYSNIRRVETPEEGRRDG